MRKVIPFLLPLLLGSCISTELKKWPTFDEAMKLPGSDTPAVLMEEEINWSNLPLLVPYASIFATSTDNSSRDSLSRTIAAKAKKLDLRPDLIVIGSINSRQTGMVHYGYGIFGNTTATSEWGSLYRLAPSRLGFTQEDKMVISITPESHAGKAGLLEGDTIVSVNGMSMDRSATSGLSQLSLEARVGTSMQVVWIRPGKGRMSAVIKTIPNRLKGLPELQKLNAVKVKERSRGYSDPKYE